MITKSLVINRNFLQIGSFKYIGETFDKLSLLSETYPGFKFWYDRTVIPDLYKNKRFIVLKIVEDDIVAVSILKKSFIEKKICTLWVHPEYKGFGLGTELLNHSFDLLKTNTPMLTVPSPKMNEFKTLLGRFDFSLYASYDDYYIKGVTEFCFNGRLPKQDFSPGQISMGSTSNLNLNLKPLLVY